MPAIAKVTLPSGAKYISTYSYADTQYFDAHIETVDSVKRSTETEYGGFARWSFGGFSFVPTLFADATDWPPPASFVMDYLKYTDTTEAAAFYLGDGVCKLKSIQRDSISYDFKPQEYTTTVAASTAYDDTLSALFTTACSTLSLTLDASATARGAAAIKYTTTADITMLIDQMSFWASRKAHAFYIDNGTLYLVDLLSTNGTATLTEFDILPSGYDAEPGYSLFKAGAWAVAGSDSVGGELDVSPIWHDVQGTVEADLANIKTVVERVNSTFEMPLESDNAPVIGKELTLTDESKVQNLTAVSVVTGISFTISAGDESMVIEGSGSLA